MSANQAVYSAGGKVIGRIVGDTFSQTYDNNDIFDKMNAKGLDYSTYLNIVNKVKYWRITHRQTKMQLSIPMSKVRFVAFKKDMGAIYGEQILVPLDKFNNSPLTEQEKMRFVKPDIQQDRLI